MKKKQKKSKKSKKFKKKNLKPKLSGKTKKIQKNKKKKSSKKIKRSKKRQFTSVKRKVLNPKIKKVKKESLALKLVKLQLSLKPQFNLKINFSLEKHIQGFFDKISQTISDYKILKAEEKRRQKLEKIENERKEKLAIDIAKSTKCEVTGITLSENQFNYCKQKAKEMNLENQVKFRLIDYRELNEKFDRIVSVGMFEHVGRKFYKKFFNQIENSLKDDGISLIHTIESVNTPRNPHT